MVFTVVLIAKGMTALATGISLEYDAIIIVTRKLNLNVRVS